MRFLLALLFLSSSAGAVELEIGQLYVGPKTLSYGDVGLSFQIARGWKGRVEGDFFVLGHDKIAGLIVARASARMSEAELQSLLSEPLELDAATVLMPQGRSKKSGGLLVQAYKSGDVVGHLVVKRAGDGRTAAFIGVSSPDGIAQLKGIVNKMGKSVNFARAPQENGFWKSKLSGLKIHKYNTTDTTTSHRRMSLCSSGAYIYYSSASGATNDLVGANVSFAGQGGERGTWKVFGTKSRGRLVLTEERGVTGTFVVTVNSKGNLLLDGSRWLRDEERATCD